MTTEIVTVVGLVGAFVGLSLLLKRPVLTSPPYDDGSVPGTFGRTIVDGVVTGPLDAPRPGPTAEDRNVLVKGSASRAQYVLSIPLDVNYKHVQEMESRFGLKFPESVIFAVMQRNHPTLDPVLVRSIMERENAGLDPRAERFEAAINDRSVGLMQILTQTAAWVAPFPGATNEQIRDRLRDPLINVQVAMKYLAWQRARYADRELEKFRPAEAWIAASYNAGSCFFNFIRSTFANESYVAFVLSRFSRFAGVFPVRKGTV